MINIRACCKMGNSNRKVSQKESSMEIKGVHPSIPIACVPVEANGEMRLGYIIVDENASKENGLSYSFLSPNPVENKSLTDESQGSKLKGMLPSGPVAVTLPSTHKDHGKYLYFLS